MLGSDVCVEVPKEQEREGVWTSVVGREKRFEDVVECLDVV